MFDVNINICFAYEFVDILMIEILKVVKSVNFIKIKGLREACGPGPGGQDLPKFEKLPRDCPGGC